MLTQNFLFFSQFCWTSGENCDSILLTKNERIGNYDSKNKKEYPYMRNNGRMRRADMCDSIKVLI